MIPSLRLLLLWSVLCCAARADSLPRITRDPYLQNGTTTNVVVRWRTDTSIACRVRIGANAGELNRELVEDNATTEHVVTIGGLCPGTKYFYAIEDLATNLLASEACHFWTHPTNPIPARILVLGDFGTSGFVGHEYEEESVRDAYYAYAGARPTDVWLTTGDNVYEFGTDDEFQQRLFDVYGTMLRNTVIRPTLGNHDVLLGANSPYLGMFSPPTQGEAGGVPSGTPRYYAFNFGNIHFVCLDSEDVPRTPGSPMLSWLERDLEANTQDWLLVYWHQPPYSKGSDDSDAGFFGPQMTEMRSYVVPILDRYGVDLVLGGHSHGYERSFLLDGHYGFSGTFTPAMAKDSGSGRLSESGAYRKAGLGPVPHQGAVYVVCGSSGWVNPNVRMDHPAMFIGLRRLGCMVIDVEGTRLDASFLTNEGAVADHFSIIKGSPPEPLRVTAFELGQGRLRAQWKSVAGQSYRIQHTMHLEEPEWLAISPIITASGATTAWTNAFSSVCCGGFYRVVNVE